MSEHNKDGLLDFSSYFGEFEDDKEGTSTVSSSDKAEPVTEEKAETPAEAEETTEEVPHEAEETTAEETEDETEDETEEETPQADEAEVSETQAEETKAPETNAQTENTPLPTEDVNDYVYAHYRKRRHKDRHRHHHSSSGQDYTNTPENENTQVVRSTSVSHFRDKKYFSQKKHKWGNRPLWQKLLIILAWVFGIILFLLLIAFITLLIMRSIGIAKLTDYKNMDMTAPVIESADVQLSDNGRSVTYNGKQYRFNTDMTSIMCLGVDREALGVDDTIGTGGQSDAIFLIALDTQTGETTIIGVPRDIVTDVGIYSPSGEYMRTEKQQLCLAYAYGDGKHRSCKNTLTAVSRLFYQLPINSYFAVDIRAIGKLNDAIGGVTVTMTDSGFYDTNGIHYYEGDVVTLFGENARKYVQHREVSELQSSADRLTRQINYLNAFTYKTLSQTKKDLYTPVNMFNIVQKRSASNLDPTTITAFASCIVTNGVSEIDFARVPGHLESDGTYAQYIVDEEQFYEMILDIYYEPVE